MILILNLAPTALAGDKVLLKDGTVVEGAITREVDGYIWLRHAVRGEVTVDMYKLSDVEVERGPATSPQLPPPVPGAIKAAVITLGDEENGDAVGVYITADSLHKMVPMLEEELGTDQRSVVVLRVHSGSGDTREVEAISNVIHDEYEPRWRVVAWIDEAVFAGAMLIHGVQDIYFAGQGNYGAAGCQQLNELGLGIADQLELMKRISARGHHNPLIMQAMLIQQPLSATVDEKAEVQWYPDDTSGQILVNRRNEILAFNAVLAEKVKFSRGTADTLAELTTKMGINQLDWVGSRGRIPWPVCKAEQSNMDFRSQTHAAEGYVRELQRAYVSAMSTAKPDRDQAASARDTLTKLIDVVNNHHDFCYALFNMTQAEFDKWAKEQKRLLDNLEK
jgi:hypothetical protein